MALLQQSIFGILFGEKQLFFLPAQNFHDKETKIVGLLFQGEIAVGGGGGEKARKDTKLPN